MNEFEEVHAAELARAAAMVAGNIEAHAKLLDERLMYTHSSGNIDSRESYLEGLRAGEWIYHSVDIPEPEHRALIDNQVITNGLMSVSMTVRATGQTVSRQIRATSVWIRRGPEWRLLVSHSTNVS